MTSAWSRTPPGIQETDGDGNHTPQRAYEGVQRLPPGTWNCVLHKNHGSAYPLRGAVHHVQPRGAGGPDVPDNRVTICETGHGNVHTVMWELVNGRPAPKCAKTELVMARLGIARWEAAGRPGSIHAFMG